MDKFLELMAEIMEVEPEEISLETEFRTACDFDSMMGFSMICVMEEEYGKRITVEQFLASKTLGALYEFIQ